MKNPKTNVSGRTPLWRGAVPVKDDLPPPKPRQETPADAERKEQEARLKPWPKGLGQNMAHGNRNWAELDRIGKERRAGGR